MCTTEKAKCFGCRVRRRSDEQCAIKVEILRYAENVPMRLFGMTRKNKRSNCKYLLSP